MTMKTLEIIGGASPQDPILGLRHQNIATELTKENWQKKAVVRTWAMGWLYVWIESFNHSARYVGRVKRHRVNVHAEYNCWARYEQTFNKLEDAIRYANGTDQRTKFARETKAAYRNQWPEEHAALFGAATYGEGELS